MMGGLARRVAAIEGRRGTAALLLIAGTLAVLALVAASLAGLQGQESSGISRVEVRLPNIDASCRFRLCPLAFGRAVRLQTPADVDSVDVVVTVTSAYAVSKADTAWLALGYQNPNAPPPPCPPPPPDTQSLWVCGGPAPMEPGAYRVGRSESKGTATLTWFKRDLPAAGRTYDFRFGVSASDADGDGRSSVAARSVVFVVETWTAGN